MTTASSFVPLFKLIYGKVPDGMGGFTKDVTSTVVIYGAAEIWEEQPTLLTQRETPLVPEDLVQITDTLFGSTFIGVYEVKSVRMMGTGPYKRLILDKTDRPTHPNVEALTDS